MRRIHINLKEHSYDIEIERGSFRTVGSRIRAVTKAERAAVITDEHVNDIYGEKLEENLRAEGFAVWRIAFPAGEKSKDISTLSRIYDELSAFEMTRSDVIITLGGGVPGDIGGFAAATWLRGVPFIQIPTSLLAQIDSSVGGKTAIDLPSGKNLVGSFCQPKAVFIDPDMLQTLPVRYLHDGLAEAIKYGCIKDRTLFEFFESIRTDKELMEHIPDIIHTCCSIKARIVEEDEYDLGERMLLNFGHTLGHAVENHYHYETYTHGEAVGIGMVMMTECTELRGITKPGTTERIRNVLETFQLPVTADADRNELIHTAEHDKKKRGKEITLIVLKDIGQGILRKMNFSELPDFLKGN